VERVSLYITSVILQCFILLIILIGLILGAFFYGYLITQVPGGWLANKYGGKWVYSVGMLLCSFMTVLTPVAAKASPYLLVAARILEGLGQVSCMYAGTLKLKSISGTRGRN